MFAKADGYSKIGSELSGALGEEGKISISGYGNIIDQEKFPSSWRQQSSGFSRAWLFVSLVINAIFSAIILWQLLQSPLPPYPDLVYSPAQHLVSYNRVTFVDGVQEDLKYDNNSSPNRPIYLGPPTNEVCLAHAIQKVPC